MIENTSDDSAVAPDTAAVATPSVRASHAERAATVDQLHAALGEGRLELDEIEERLAAAYGSRYRSDLLVLLADLPSPQPGSRWAQAWQAVISQTWISLARACGTKPTDPTRRQQRAMTVMLVAGVLWMVLCLLVGFSVGLLG